MKNKKKALIINIIILILEVITFSYTYITNHSIAIEYYTIDSNLLALLTSLLFIIFYKQDNNIIKDLRFITTTALTLTFLVVIFILCPMYNFNYKGLMLENNFLVFHTLVPILSIISYLLFETKSNKNYLGFVFTIIYSIILIILNVLNIIVGPYPFLEVKNQGIIMSMFWCILIVGGSYLIGLFLNKKGAKN